VLLMIAKLITLELLQNVMRLKKILMVEILAVVHLAICKKKAAAIIFLDG
jgi:hypothetical protein